MPWGSGGVPCRGGYPGQGGTLVRYPPARSGWGGTLLGGTLAGGVPWPGGTLVRYPPSQVRMGGYPAGGVPWLGGYPGWGVPWSGTPPARSGWGGYPGRTTEGVLTTRRAVCLLRSRRRTFLFNLGN